MSNQEAVHSDIERLFRESSVPQIYQDHNTSSSNNNFVLPCSRLGHQMSASAIPKMHAYATASPCAHFAPFRSPQSLNVTYPSHSSYPSAADIFRSLKNQPRPDGANASPDTSQEIDNSSKENNSAAANDGNQRGWLMLKNMQPRVERLRGHGWQSNVLQDNQYNTSSITNNNNETRGNIHVGQADELRYQIHRNHAGNRIIDKGDNFYEETFQEAFFDAHKDQEVIPEKTESCALHMWIIKPVPGTQSICVEGKKSLADDTFWHSGVITQRVNEKTVETQTGSLYRLEGNMELLDAMAAGFSRKTAEAFWLGFPADWKQLIKEHFSTVYLKSIPEDPYDVEEEITTLEDDAEDSVSLDTEEEDVTLTEQVSTDGGNDFGPSVVPKENEQVEVFHSPVDNKKAGAKKGSKAAEVVIENWIIKLLPNGKGIHVIGNKQDSGHLWHSSVIEKRLDKKRLVSSSGSKYRLKGNLDRLLALNEGLPLQIINKFSSGFPKEWQELVQEFLCTKKPKKKKADKSKPKKKKAVTESSKDKGQESEGQKKEINVKEKVKHGKDSKVKKVITSRQRQQRDQLEIADRKVRERQKQRSISIRVETQKWTKNVLTPNGEMVDLESLGRSRSGRLIKPPLQWWTGQTLELEGDTITVKAPTAAASMFLQNFEEGYKKSTQKVKSYWNPREKDKDYSINTTRSSLSSSMSSVDTDGVSKFKNEVQSSSKSVDGACKSSESKLDSEIKVEINVILEKAKSKRTKVKKRETCYNRRKEEKGSTVESDQPFELNETSDLDNTAKTEQELSDQNSKRRTSKRQQRNRSKRLSKEEESDEAEVEQENVVSSSTGDLDNKNDKQVDGSDKVEESRTGRALRSRKVKTLESNCTDMLSKGNRKPENCKSRERIYQTRKTKILSVIVEDEADDRDHNEEAKDREHSQLKTASKKKSPGNSKGKLQVKKMNSGKTNVPLVDSVDKSVDEIVDHWTKEEKDRLKEACKKVPPNNPYYWEKVAAEVRTKNAELCKEMYYSAQKKPSSAEKKNKKTVKEKVKVSSLTANVGTLKRKQQLRDLLKQQNDDYSDDLFDSTPYRLTRKRKVPILGKDDDDAIFEELARKQGKSRFETPVATDSTSSRIMVPFASTKKTPVSNVNLEMLEENVDVDGYVHKILKRRLLAKGKKKAVTIKPSKKVVEEVIPQKSLLREYLKVTENAENHHDSDQEEDFYWEDETEN